MYMYRYKFFNTKKFCYHSGEWISGSVCMYIVDRLLSGYGQDEGVCVVLYTKGKVLCPVFLFCARNWILDYETVGLLLVAG